MRLIFILFLYWNVKLLFLHLLFYISTKKILHFYIFFNFIIFKFIFFCQFLISFRGPLRDRGDPWGWRWRKKTLRSKDQVWIGDNLGDGDEERECTPRPVPLPSLLLYMHLLNYLSFCKIMYSDNCIRPRHFFISLDELTNKYDILSHTHTFGFKPLADVL